MIPFFNNLKPEKNILGAAIFYLFVCVIFIAKYSYNKLGYGIVNQSLASLFFLITILFLTQFYQNFSTKVRGKTIFISALTAAVFAMIALIYSVDLNSLDVDRWSAFDVAVKSVLNQQYPYDKIDHLGGRTSNFPGLILLGMPAYLFQNMGMFTVFSSVIFGFALLKSFSNEKALLVLFLLFASIPFWWEIYVVSDLMGNFLLIASFLLLAPVDISSLKTWSIIYIAIIAALLAYTRIPAAMLIGTYFFQQIVGLKNPSQIESKKRVYKMALAIFIFCTTITLLTFWVFSLAPNWQTIEKYNPFSLQSSYLPITVNLLCGLLPFILLFLVKKDQLQLIKIGGISLAIPVFLSFAYTLNECGWHACIYESKFDISYFNMALPFAIVIIVSSLPNTPRSKPQPHPTTE